MREPEEHPHAPRCEESTPHALVPSPSSGFKDRIGCRGRSRRLPPLAYIIKYIVEGVEEGTFKLALKVRNHECSVVSLGNVVLRMTFGKSSQGSGVQ